MAHQNKNPPANARQIHLVPKCFLFSKHSKLVKLTGHKY